MLPIESYANDLISQLYRWTGHQSMFKTCLDIADSLIDETE